MKWFTWAELTDMLQVYGNTRGNSCAARCIYQERRPNRHVPHHTTFASVNRHLRERGLSTRADGQSCRCTMRPSAFEEGVLQQVELNPATSTLAIAHRMRSTPATDSRSLFPYHRQQTQVMGPRDYPQCLQFARWCIQHCQTEPGLTKHVLFTDEACFTHHGFFNSHNMHLWDNMNPRGISEHRH
ncbi:hypothetical protein PR048_029852 [Dryococelus australis]|uniref:DUF4817 domain-containing protein n=1 Tax=Dryococelus australis TaxID=614101 RepID=A0ABQ9GB93_9NEOP|nr:hypothetical protein PR048_029852 [Dryococelus australis]